MNPSKFKKKTTIKAHIPPSPYSEASYDNKSHPQKETKKFTMSKSPTASSLEENRKKLKILTRMIHFLEFVRIVFFITLFSIGLVCMFLSYISVNVFGMPFYSFLLLSHSLTYLGLLIVHYHLFPPLLDKSSIIGDEMKEEFSYMPAYHRSKNELLWCYSRIFLAILINAGIWKYLTYMDFPYDENEADKVLHICFLSGILMTCVFAYVMAYLGPVSDRVIIKKQNTHTWGKDASYSKLLQEKDKILMEKDKILMELLHAKDDEIKRLRRENEEANNKNH
ncbi:hypothetical protein MOSE0_G00210 [Monosporozyma servazzii]